MNYDFEEDGAFSGELPNGDITHDEDEFWDEWADRIEAQEEGYQ